MRIARAFAFLSLISLLVWTAHSDDVAELRLGGQPSVDILHQALGRASAADRSSLEERLDRVCAQKDCAASRLFWYTDFEAAKVAAQRYGRPILALYMLGRLDEEMSCANSRFFRTLLYSDDAISNRMREDYILYWHSVRDVPRVTIEMGDGRVIRQTITGNSAHYLLDETGGVLDALPGLYSPAAFLEQLERWTTLHRSLAGVEPAARGRRIRGYHLERLRAQRIALAPRSDAPRVVAAAAAAVSKSVTERPLMRQLEVSAAMTFDPSAYWMSIGEREMGNVQFSAKAIELIRRKQFGEWQALDTAMGELLDNLRRTVAADTAYNESQLHQQIHRWFVGGEVRDLQSLNERVYRDLFFTPSDDPWLGLKPASIFTALDPRITVTGTIAIEEPGGAGR